jgi:uncharacterized protein YegJ (DUF2314 family)
MTSKFDSPQEEPLFVAIANDDPTMVRAFALAAATSAEFLEHVKRPGNHYCCAKLKFRDPDHSAALGEDRFVYLWLAGVHYHGEQGLYSGQFFEVPPALQKWHQVGQRLAFEADDVFDWMVLDSGVLHGGFTIRAAREALPEAERAAYDSYVGAESYAPILPQHGQPDA